MFKAYFKDGAFDPSAAPPRESARIELDTEGSPHIQAVAERASQQIMRVSNMATLMAIARYFPCIRPIPVAMFGLIGVNK